MWRTYFVPVLLLGVAIDGSAWAQIYSGNSATIKFEGTQPLEEVSWSAGVSRTAAGLMITGVPATSERPFWIQSPPVSAGISWRPPRSTTAAVTVNVPQLNSGGYLRAYVRYSIDRVHWSSWQILSESPSSTPSVRQFQAWLSPPVAAREKYDALMREWWNTNPVWSSDEHEFCMWLASLRPEYFATEVPFIGYLQVRLEGGAQEMRLSEMTVSGGVMESGLQVSPRGDLRRATADGPWFFDLNKVQIRSRP
jgi:hypothetical protein